MEDVRKRLSKSLLDFVIKKEIDDSIAKNIFYLLKVAIEFVETEKRLLGSEKKKIVLDTLNTLIKSKIRNEKVSYTIIFLIEEALENLICISKTSLKVNRNKKYNLVRSCIGF